MKPQQKTDVPDGSHSVRRACVAVCCFYIFLLIFNGKGIDTGVRRMEYGRQRDFLLKVTAPLAWISEATQAALLRAGVAQSAGNWLNGAD